MNALRFIFQLIDRMSGPARRIRDSLSGVRRELGRTRSAFNNLYDSTSGLRMVTAGLAAGFAALTVGAAAGIGAMAIKYASFKEQAETSFQVLLKSKKAGSDLYNQAVRFAAITPFDTQGVISGFQQLLSFGFKPVEIPVVMSGVGDLASIKGFSQESVQRIILAMGQIKAKGRLMGQEMLQLTEAGFSQAAFYQLLSKKTGKSLDQIRKLQEAGKIDAGTALGGILETIKMTNSGGKLGNLMKQQSNTLAGLWSTLASRPFEMLQHFDKAGAFADLKAVIKNLGDAFDTTTPKGKAMSKALVSLADTIVGGIFGPMKDATGPARLADTLNRITAGIKRFQVFWAAAFPQALAFFRGFIEGVRAGWAIIQNAYQTAKPMIDWVSAFVARLTGAKTEAGSTAEALGRVVGIFGVLAVAAGGLSMLLVPIRLLLGVADAFYSIWKIGRGVVRTFGQVGKLAKAFKDWGGLARVFAPVTRFFGTVGRYIGTFIAWVGRAGPILRGFFMAIRAGASFLFASNPFGMIALAVIGVVMTAVWAYNRFAWFRNAVNAIWGAIKAGALAAWDGIRGVILTFWGWLSGDESATRTGTALMVKFGNALRAGWAAFSNWAYNAGAAIIDGIKNGVASKWQDLKATISNTAQSVGDWFKDILGIASPSKVFTGFGGFIIDGLVNGIDAGKSAISGTVKGISTLLSEMWLRYRPTFGGVNLTGGPLAPLQGAAGGNTPGAASAALSGVPVGKSNSVIANAAMQGLTAGWAESLPGYCSRFVRQVFARAVGPATSRLFGSSAIQTERNFKAAGLSKTLNEIGGLAGLKAGDVLFQGFGSGGFGHTGVYVGNGMVAQNTTAAGGGKKLLPVSAFGAITSVGRMPTAQAPAPMRQAAPASASRGGNTIHVNNTLSVPPGTPAQQAAKLKADAHKASYEGAALALEQMALQGGHA